MPVLVLFSINNDYHCARRMAQCEGIAKVTRTCGDDISPDWTTCERQERTGWKSRSMSSSDMATWGLMVMWGDMYSDAVQTRSNRGEASPKMMWE